MGCSKVYSEDKFTESLCQPAALQRRDKNAVTMPSLDIRTTLNTYGDVVTDELVQASGKVAALALKGRETAGMER